MEQSSLETNRLLLRPFVSTDASVVQRLAGDRAVADTTRNIPHPYADGMAEQWIATLQPRLERGEIVNFAIVPHGNNFLIGAVGLVLNPPDNKAELGYWIGQPFWKHGFATEAAGAVLAFGFGGLGLNRVHASCLRRNPTSARVLQKIGMVYEGCLRQHFKKWEWFEDIEQYGILRAEWKPAATTH